MSGSNDLTKIRSIKISDTHNFLDIASESGTHSRKLENGVVVTLTIEKGKIVKTAAHDSKGNPLKTFHMKMHSVVPEDGEPICYACVAFDGFPSDYGDNQMCFPAPCKLM
jgi:hypothetical protein